MRTFNDRLERARKLVESATAAGVEITNGNVRDLLLDNMETETVATAGDLANRLGFNVQWVSEMVTEPFV